MTAYFICEVEGCDREVEYRCQHPPFTVDGKDKQHSFFCENHADDMVHLAAAIGMPINMVEDFQKVVGET